MSVFIHGENHHHLEGTVSCTCDFQTDLAARWVSHLYDN